MSMAVLLLLLCIMPAVQADPESVISLLLLLLEKRGLLPLGAMQRMAPMSKFTEYFSLLCASTTLLLVMAALFGMGPLSLIITTPPTDVYMRMYSAAYCIYVE